MFFQVCQLLCVKIPLRWRELPENGGLPLRKSVPGTKTSVPETSKTPVLRNIHWLKTLILIQCTLCYFGGCIFCWGKSYRFLLKIGEGANDSFNSRCLIISHLEKHQSKSSHAEAIIGNWGVWMWHNWIADSFFGWDSFYKLFNNIRSWIKVYFHFLATEPLPKCIERNQSILTYHK